MTTWQSLAHRLRAARESAKKQAADSLENIAQSVKRSRSEKPPKPPRSASPNPFDEEDDIELLGRDSSYHHRDWEKLQESEVRVVKSSNVYSYAFEHETKAKGILFVTFLEWEPGMKQSARSGPGSTYAYYDVPTLKYRQFQKAADASAGTAVWDYLRIRQSSHDHQHRYRLIQVAGDYVPRKATKTGLSRRALIAPGLTPEVRRKLAERALDDRDTGSVQFFKESSKAPKRRK